MAAGSKWPVKTPLLGEACLISAMIAGLFAAKAARKFRRSVRAAARRSKSSRKCADAASAVRLEPAILARISGIAWTIGGKFHGSTRPLLRDEGTEPRPQGSRLSHQPLAHREWFSG